MPRRTRRQLVGPRPERYQEADELDLAELACELHALQRRALVEKAEATGDETEPEDRKP